MSHCHPSSDRQTTASIPELAQQLRTVDQTLPEALQAQILRAGSAIAPDLIAILEETLADDETDHGWPPSHAAKLLGQIGDGQAVPALLRFLEHYDVLDSYHDDAADALSALGDVAIEACLAAYPTAFDENLRDGIASVLRRSAIKDDRIFHALVDFLEQSPELGAMYLAEYGDLRAVPSLSRMFDVLPVVDRDGAMTANHVFVELRCAIEELGGQLTAEQTAKAERVDAPRRRFAAQMDEARQRLRTLAAPKGSQPAPPWPSNGEGAAARKRRKWGRNERCWCGSGKKYKKCHLDLEH
jgi:NADPH-dependent ferric siderophore reductase